MKKTYFELLKHPKWQARRLEVLNRAGFACEECGDKETTLHAHHLLYRKGAKPWEYSDHELRCLCENCHAHAHAIKEEIEKCLADVAGGSGIHGLVRILGYVRAAAAESIHGRTQADTTIEALNLDDIQGVVDFIGPTMLSVVGLCEAARENDDQLPYRQLRDAARLLGRVLRDMDAELQAKHEEKERTRAIHEGNEQVEHAEQYYRGG